MSEWLELMLEEIARKKREYAEANEEIQRRRDASSKDSTHAQASPAVSQSK